MRKEQISFDCYDYGFAIVLEHVVRIYLDSNLFFRLIFFIRKEFKDYVDDKINKFFS